MHKKDSKSEKDYYRPISVLPNISKIYERFLFKFQNICSNFFPNINVNSEKGFSAQHSLLSILEKWESAVGNKIVFGALLTDLSKAFDCLSHDLLVAKLNAYGFSMAALRLIQNYLSNRKQRTKIKT